MAIITKTHLNKAITKAANWINNNFGGPYSMTPATAGMPSGFGLPVGLVSEKTAKASLMFSKTQNPSNGGNQTEIDPLGILKKSIRKLKPKTDFKDLETAYQLMAKHYGQEAFSSGQTIINHKMKIAGVAALWGTPINIIAAEFIADIPVKKINGKIAAQILELAVERNYLEQLAFKPGRKTKQGALFLNLLLSKAKHPLILTLLAAKNYCDLQNIPIAIEKENEGPAWKGLYVFSKLLKILGLHKVPGAMQDLAYINLAPTTANLEEFGGRLDRLTYLTNLHNEHLSFELKDQGIEHHGLWRIKSIESEKQKTRKVNDHRGMRYIVNEKADCYLALAVIQSKMNQLGFDYDPKLSKDFILDPTETGYQALHAKFINKQTKKYIEIQFRSKDMDNEAEYGKCSHLKYKTHAEGFTPEITAPLLQGKFNTAAEAARRSIYIYDKDLYLHELRPHSHKESPSVLDFAAQFGWDSFRHCSGAEIIRNGKRKTVSFKYKLESGDQIIELKLKGKPIKYSEGRFGAAKTILAQSLLTFQERNLQPLKRDTRLAEKDIRDKGKKIFNGKVEELKSEIFSSLLRKLPGTPQNKFLFSLKRICGKLNLSSEEMLYTALALNPDLIKDIEGLVRENYLIISFNPHDTDKHENQVQLLAKDRAGILANILEQIVEQKIDLRGLSIKQDKNGSRKVGLTIGPTKKARFEPFVGSLENIYRHTSPRKNIAYRFYRIELPANIRILSNILGVIVDKGGVIDEASSQAKNKQIELSLLISIPFQGHQNAVANIEKQINLIFPRKKEKNKVKIEEIKL